MPKRIQMTRTKPWRCDAPDAVIVDRTSKWGNPFKVGADLPGMPGQPMDAEDACQCFEIFTIPELPVHELAGKDLACWCALDAPCHADVLLKYAARCTADKGVTHGR
ncbi:hypothetical protein FIV06_23960 [Labrenzia sp. THAF191b]|jgi:hypothetical protein|uniref:DUF4326 domain-containing protein n=1 Tax=unclassified Labrenzia TaxID=2648686 RepID=UPI0012689523|nr:MULTISPECIES: DUF4326 domain-containing protein [unclassified Labrenzia]QFT00505.1 hypothetical protein FIV06_23960 [Labrenzia sp. THAF191b]QFT06818.1 hypothetical protein FIV05_23955 [Labrenzia sp. THAF191a]QFT18362.1 hypothetical protein FIV03_23970 [Labrenzia sp. THAF187b]